MMDPSLRTRLRFLEIRARHLADSRLLGEWISNIQGQGLDFRDLRDYVPGDDIRRLDWKATARTGKPHIRQFQEDRQQTVHLALDLSASMNWGLKAQRASEILALVGWAAVLQKDRFSLTGFTDRLEFTREPRRGEAQLWSALQDLMTFRPQGKKTQFSSLWNLWFSSLTHRSTCILLSDFQVEMPQLDMGALKALAAKHDLWIFHIHDPAELASGGLVELEDAESGARSWVDASQGSRLKKNRYLLEEERLSFASQIRKNGGWYGYFPVDQDPFALLLEFLKKRERVVHV